ncbi:MAG: citrate lyase ACP [Gemmatimonadetes bacterium]|nr:citrate lyase ACP [Gemmatimonadota bacterium]NNM07337.1 citrate lyase ACP [Gemmatimonadota bacterium]
MAGQSVVGEAGRRGSDVRSDCWVAVEEVGSGGIQLELTSKVDGLFGQAIRQGIHETLGAFACEHLVVRVEDQGALPWVIQARLETALHRGGIEPLGDPRPPARPPHRPNGTPKDRLRRSRLYLPGNEPKFAVNAGLHLPDGVILDLEDSVHPGEKDAARLMVRNALRCVDFGQAERMVRINQGDLGLEDLDLVVPEMPEMILIPKVETSGQVKQVQARIDAIQEDQGSDHPIWLMPILESAQGVENAVHIALASPSVAALTIGLEDYTADLGVVKTPEGFESLWARSRLVNAARAAGVQAIDSVYGDVADEAGLLAWCKRSRAMGFQGMGCIHPRQIRIIHDGFAPGEEELQKALRIVAAFEEAEAKGLGVVSLGTKMIDRPVVLRAQKLVGQAREAGLFGDHGEEGEVTP